MATKTDDILLSARQSSVRNSKEIGIEFSSLTIDENLEQTGNETAKELKLSQIWDSRQISTDITKPSTITRRLISRRKREHDQAMKQMKEELSNNYANCQQEFRTLSKQIKNKIHEVREEIEDTKHNLQGIDLSSLEKQDFDSFWDRVKMCIDSEVQHINEFHRNLLEIEARRLDHVKPTMQKYYNIFHKISHLSSDDIENCLESEIMNYNETIMGNHRVYADLYLQLCLNAYAEKIDCKHWMISLEIKSRDTISHHQPSHTETEQMITEN